MKQDVRESVTSFLGKNGWTRPKVIIDELYPDFKEAYAKDTFKRLVFRVLKCDPGIVKNSQTFHYSLKAKRKPFSKHEIEFIKKFFDMAANPWAFYDPELEMAGIPQYPNIRLEMTVAFARLAIILHRLWRDSREDSVIDPSNLPKDLQRHIDS